MGDVLRVNDTRVSDRHNTVRVDVLDGYDYLTTSEARALAIALLQVAERADAFERAGADE